MASKSRGKARRGIPLATLIAGAHAAYDIATKASCPNCGHQVVLYICTGCKKPVRPIRGQASAM